MAGRGGKLGRGAYHSTGSSEGIGRGFELAAQGLSNGTHVITVRAPDGPSGAAEPLDIDTHRII